MRKVLCVLLLILPGTISQAQISNFGNVNFHKADSIANHYKGEGLDNLPLLSHKLTAPLSSQVEKFRSIYIWVCQNIANDYVDYLKNRKMRKKFSGAPEALAKWNAEIRAEMFQKLLKKRKTVCTGYAYLVRELAVFADINCKIIDGYGRTVESNIGGSGVLNHSWNAVELDNRWYLCDATWSSGHTLIPSYTFVHEYNEGYFLADPVLFAQNHYPLDTQWLLMDTVPELEGFLHAPLIYKPAFTYQMLPIEPKRMNISLSENEKLRLVFAAPDSLDVENIYLELGLGLKKLIKRPEILRNEEGHLVIEHPFTKRLLYDVHVKLGEDYITSYTVKVKKSKK